MKKICWGIIGIVCGLAGVVQADLYQVEAIPVTAAAGSAMEAREIAIANGQVEAFWLLLQKMANREDLERVPLIGQEEVLNFVQNVSLADEKATATKYMADMTVRFKPKVVQDFLTEYQVPFLVQEPATALVIPVYQKGEEILLLSPENPVWAAFKNISFDNDLFHWIVPDDMPETAAAVQAAFAGEADWQAVLKTRGTQRVFLWQVIQNGPTVEVVAQGIPEEQNGWDRISFQTMVPGGDIAWATPQLWKRTEGILEKAWRADKTNRLEKPNTFWVSVPIDSLADWERIRQKLVAADFLNGMVVRGFRPRQALVALAFKGAGEQLDEKLGQLGLQVQPMAGSSAWILTERTVQEGPMVEEKAVNDSQ